MRGLIQTWATTEHLSDHDTTLKSGFVLTTRRYVAHITVPMNYYTTDWNAGQASRFHHSGNATPISPIL